MYNISTDYTNYDTKRRGPFDSIIALILLGVLMFVLYYAFKGVYKLLYIGAPILLLVTLIINYRVVWMYFVDMINLFRRDVLSGVLKMAFTVLCYPLVIGWLFIKAIFFYKIDQMRQNIDKQTPAFQKTLYSDYEEISSKKNGNTDADAQSAPELKSKNPRKKPID